MSTAKELLKLASDEKKKVICERREKIINAVIENNIIWDKRLSEHKDSVAVDVAWDLVSQTTGVSKALAKKEWKYLRDQFRTNLTLVKIKKSGSGYDPEKDFEKIKWPYFKQMLFLKDIVSKRETSCNIDEEKEVDGENSHQNNDAEAFKILSSIADGGFHDEVLDDVLLPTDNSGPKSVPSTSSSFASTSSFSSARPPSAANFASSKRKGTKRCAMPNDDILEEMGKIDKVMIKVAETAAAGRTVSEDAADRFGKYIADIFRRVKTNKQPKFELKLIQTAFSFISDSDSE